MRIHEFRIPLNMHVDEYFRAQLYMVMQESEKQTDNGEGVEVLENKPYDNTAPGEDKYSEITGWKIPRTKGQYTLKKYYIASRLPTILQSIVPKESMVLVEEAWNAYPHCTTVIANAYLSKEKFFICIESIYLPDHSDCPKFNPHNISEKELKKRTVEKLDIAQSNTKKPLPVNEDPKKYTSRVTGRGPLQPGWEKKVDPLMTCYKLIRTSFEYWGLQKKIEELVINQQRDLFSNTHREVHCSTDDWHGLSLDDIRRMEDESKARLEEKRRI